MATHPLITTTMGVALRTPGVMADTLAHLAVKGVHDFTWEDGDRQLFGGRFYLNQGCPSKRDYDGLDTNAYGVVTHRFSTDVNDYLNRDGAVVMRANPSGSWNTVLMSFNWFDIVRYPAPADQDAIELAQQVLTGALPPLCHAWPDTNTVGVPENVPPRITRLYQNVPNPFNPLTTIRFDLATKDHVELRLYNVAGRLVRTLVDATLPAARHEIVWDGKDDHGQRVSSGIYFYRLSAGDVLDTKKLVMLK